jgi:Tfp pilus assembly protein PilF
MNVGYAAKTRGDTAAARLNFEQALAADTSQALPRIELGYLALAGGDRPRAADFLRQGVDRDPSRPELHRQLGYVLISLKRTREAITAFEGIAKTTSGLTPVDHLALGYLYDDVGREASALAAFKAASLAADTVVSMPAQRALRVKQGPGTSYFSEGYIAPFYQTRFENTIATGFTRLGIESGSSWGQAAYTSLRVTRDSKSGGGLQSRVLSDNAAILAGGVRVRPARGPIWLYAEAGGARSLLSGAENSWTRDIRAGAYVILAHELQLGDGSNVRLLTDLSGDVSWYERFDKNVIGYMQLREGFRVGSLATKAVDFFARGWVGYDSRGDFFNRAAEIGGGVALRPGHGFVFLAEGIAGRFIMEPPAATNRRYQDWRFTAVYGWRKLKPLHDPSTGDRK